MSPRIIVAGAVALAIAGPLSACGKLGQLEPPGPLNASRAQQGSRLNIPSPPSIIATTPPWTPPAANLADRGPGAGSDRLGPARRPARPLRQPAPVNHFEIKGGELTCEDVPLARIAETIGTPVYVYSTATLERHYTVLRDALVGAGLRDPLIAFAVKANSNVAVLSTLARLGAGADVVSEGEIRRALAAGVPAQRIVFSGVGKTADEVAFALETDVAEINVSPNRNCT